MKWLQQHKNAKIVNSNPESKFLARRSHASTILASTQSKEEYFQIIKQLL
jgi:hypothetical protein